MRRDCAHLMLSLGSPPGVGHAQPSAHGCDAHSGSIGIGAKPLTKLTRRHGAIVRNICWANKG